MTGAEPQGAARELVGRSLIDLGAMIMESRGERVSWARRSVIADQMLTRNFLSSVGGQHTTTDFPLLLAGAGNRVLLGSYKSAECPLKAIARRRNAADFRAISMLRLSEAPRLDKVGESGEITYGTRSETKEGFKVDTYARIFGISRNALINDDLGAFSDSTRAWGRSAAETEAELLVSLFTANGGDGVNMDDGNPLYSTVRGNMAATPSAIDVTNFSLARQAMRERKGTDGKSLISVTAKHLVVGPAKETEAEVLASVINAAKLADVNPFGGRVTVHVEPRFSGNAWRLFADPTEVDVVTIGYLDGNNGPMLDVREGWTTLGAEFRCVLDFGCGISDWRGTHLNAGA